MECKSLIACVQASVERAGGKTIIKFTRAFDATFTGDGTIGALAAYHGTESKLGAPHEKREAFEFSLAGAAGGPAAAGPSAGEGGSTTARGTPSGATSTYFAYSSLVSVFLGALGIAVLL